MNEQKKGNNKDGGGVRIEGKGKEGNDDESRKRERREEEERLSVIRMKEIEIVEKRRQ